MSSKPALLALAAAALTSASCGELRYTRVMIQRPPAPASVELLTPGLELGRCFELLGAPHLVEPLDNDDAVSGYLCSWIWFHDSGYSVQVSAPIDNSPSASVTYSSQKTRVPALQLEFGPDDILRRFERSWLDPGRVRVAPTELGGPLGILF